MINFYVQLLLVGAFLYNIDDAEEAISMIMTSLSALSVS